MASCLRCSKEFVKASGVQKYCTRECLKAAVSESKKGPLRQVHCKGCEKVFETTNALIEFCSAPCRHSHFNSLRPTTKHEIRSCVACGASFQPMQKTGPGRKWCSEACKHIVGGNPQRLEKLLKGAPEDAEKLAAARAWRRDWGLKKAFGIALEEYDRMHAKQNGLCAICNRPERAKSNYGPEARRLAVDHCHSTGKIRALLCSACNTMLGHAEDSVETLSNAIEYLKSHTGD